MKWERKELNFRCLPLGNGFTDRRHTANSALSPISRSSLLAFIFIVPCLTLIRLINHPRPPSSHSITSNEYPKHPEYCNHWIFLISFGLSFLSVYSSRTSTDHEWNFAESFYSLSLFCNRYAPSLNCREWQITNYFSSFLFFFGLSCYSQPWRCSFFIVLKQ